MLHKFPYSEFDPLEIPADNISGVYTLSEQQGGEDEDIVQAALNAPIGSARLRDEVAPGMTVAIAVDDSSRNTRTELMLPMILAELEAGGVARKDIAVVIALGTHRPMTQQEMAQKYTAQVVQDYRIVNHDWHDRSGYAPVGIIHGGVEIKVHHEIINADYVVGVGQTIPHMIAGFGGGCKIINPGCSDGETIGQMHWLCNEVPEGQLFAVRENPVRDLIDKVALKVGLKFILNEVPGATGIAGAFAGHPVEAHKQACEFSKQVAQVKIRELADIVIADAYPADIDFWQALKGLNAAYGAVKPGGTVILITTCPEGTSSQHDELTKYGYLLSAKQIRSMVAEGALEKGVAANLILGRQLLEKASTTLVTIGISKEDTQTMGFQWGPNPTDALQLALKKHGQAATINVLYKASKMVCSLDE